MGTKNGKLDRALRELIAALQKTPDLELSEGWRQNLMQDIARSPRPEKKADRREVAPDMGRLVFRFAGACATAAALLAVYSLISGIDIDNDVARLALQTQVDFISQQLIGPLSGGLLS